MNLWPELVAIVTVLGTIGFWSALAYLARWWWTRIRWKRLRVLVKAHVQEMKASGEIESRLLGEIAAQRQSGLAVHLLSEARFSPSECLKFLRLGEAIVEFEQGLAMEELATAKTSFER